MTLSISIGHNFKCFTTTPKTLTWWKNTKSLLSYEFLWNSLNIHSIYHNKKHHSFFFNSVKIYTFYWLRSAIDHLNIIDDVVSRTKIAYLNEVMSSVWANLTHGPQSSHVLFISVFGLYCEEKESFNFEYITLILCLGTKFFVICWIDFGTHWVFDKIFQT